ncbi:MAG: hypothetical protein HRU09_06110 [Oligoflexales bacterium]|nr:hypothetical protein [Oligoflexales bacterium]
MSENIEPHPPLIPSQLSAALQSENLRKSQDFHTYDAEGLLWQLKVCYQQKPNSSDPSKLLWEVSLQLSTKVDVEALIRTKTIDPKKDERLAFMLKRHEPIHFAIRPKIITTSDEHASLKQAKLAIPSYLKQVENKPLNEFKRKSICRIIDEGCRFK